MTYSAIQLPIKPHLSSLKSASPPTSHTTFFITITITHYNNFIHSKMHASTLFLLAVSALTASAAPAPAPGSDHRVDGYAHHREKEPERYTFHPEFYDEKRYHRTPKSPPYGKDFVYYDGAFDGGKGKGREKEKEKEREKKEKVFKDVERKESKHDKDRFSKKVEEDEEERFKKEKEREKEEESRKFEECAESKREEVCDEQCCFEEGYGIFSFFF